MSTRSIEKEEFFEVAPERMFDMLITPSQIRGWWQATRVLVMPKTGGVWAAAWGEEEDEPDYLTVATIADYDPPRRLLLTNYLYTAKTGPLPFEADFSTEFNVTPSENGSLLRVVNAGFPSDSAADEFFAGCQQGWIDTFGGIRRFLES